MRKLIIVRTISFTDLDDFLTTDFPQPSYIIEPLVSDQSIVQIVGASGVGKTMFGLAIAGAIATANGLLGMTKCWRTLDLSYT